MIDESAEKRKREDASSVSSCERMPSMYARDVDVVDNDDEKGVHLIRSVLHCETE